MTRCARAPTSHLTNSCPARAQGSLLRKCRGAGGLQGEPETAPSSGAVGFGQAAGGMAGGRAGAGRELLASMTPARDSSRPRPAGRAAPREHASLEGRTAEGGRGCRSHGRRPGLSSAPPFAAHGNPDAGRCEDAHASACTPGQCREGCSHQRGSHSGYGHRGMRLAPHAAEGAPLDMVTARRPGARRGRPRACPDASRAEQGKPCVL